MSGYQPYDSAGNKYGELQPAPQPVKPDGELPRLYNTVIDCLHSAGGYDQEAHAKHILRLIASTVVAEQDKRFRDGVRLGLKMAKQGVDIDGVLEDLAEADLDEAIKQWSK